MYVRFMNVFLFSIFLATSGRIEKKYKVCVVDGRGGFKKVSKYCPLLDQIPESKVECVIGLDRLDCLRKISKGTADWSVFTPEDLITAQNSGVEMLITNELRFTEDKYEYEMVAVVNNLAGISNKHDLVDKKLCHPGYGYETDFTTILANYLENNVVPQNCISSLSLTENRIKATSEYFKAACKAGPWVKDPILDSELKRKYKNLCELCGNPGECSTSDKYWGRRGPLYCLTDGLGDVSWSRLDDVRIHFDNITSKSYSFLCPDGATIPLNFTKPCVWVVKPWPVVATRRLVSQEIQTLVTSLDAFQGSVSWQSALLDLIENFRVNIVSVKPMQDVETYLDYAPGYLSANSFVGCHPPRSIRICTVSNTENAKCAWLREAAAVYGIEPGLECYKADNKTHCMSAVNQGKVDVVIVSPEDSHKALSVYKLKIILYETVKDEDKYLTVAITKKKDLIQQFSQLTGRKSCFPYPDGIAFNTVANTITNLTSSEKCSSASQVISNFFIDTCVSGAPNLNSGCSSVSGDYEALWCLVSGQGDVAFVSKNSYDRYFNDVREIQKMSLNKSDWGVLCVDPTKKWCHLSWAPIGLVMVRSNITDVWLKDALHVFLQMDDLFGKNHKSATNTMTMFGLFNGNSDVLFHDVTAALRPVPVVKSFDNMPRSYPIDIIQTKTVCSSSSPVLVNFYVIFLIFFVCK